jgi:hypothetical protein
LRAKRIAVVAAAAAGLVTVCCGVALAAGVSITLPFSGDGNTINGCYSSGGALKLLTVGSPACPSGYVPIHWSVIGPKGDKGDPGTNGTPGAAGGSPTVTVEPPGGNCSAGGAAITAAGGSPVYVCNGQTGQPGNDGAPFSGTFTSPNGHYSISVTDTGVTLHGPGPNTIRLTDTDLRIESSSPVTIKGGQAVDVQAGTNLGLKASSNLSVQASGTVDFKAAGLLDLTGSSVGINGGASCKPAARVGDPILQDTPSLGVGKIVGGDPTVCIGG